MNKGTMNLLVGLLAGLAVVSVAPAQTPTALIYDAGVGAIFAAGDLKVALRQNGYAVTESPFGDPSRAKPPVRIILTTKAVAVPGMPVRSCLAAQGYAIQRVVDSSATNWWVIGH